MTHWENCEYLLRVEGCTRKIQIISFPNHYSLHQMGVNNTRSRKDVKEMPLRVRKGQTQGGENPFTSGVVVVLFITEDVHKMNSAVVCALKVIDKVSSETQNGTSWEEIVSVYTEETFNHHLLTGNNNKRNSIENENKLKCWNNIILWGMNVKKNM